ncbi:S8 family serine peptidase [Streptomyces sp. NPDC059534]|uniref:S8 family serine peptidase n=1 Tax=Streptomyces sp. NPDC059534 TaxID=3346859 RepID=UPI003678924A
MTEQGGGVKPGNGGKGARSQGTQSTAGKQPGEMASGVGEPGGQGEQVQPEMSAGARVRGLRAGWGRYLVAPRPLGLLGGGVPPVEASALFALLEEDPEVEPVAQVRPSRSRGLGAIAELYPACPPVAVVVMPEERARALAANPQVVVEIDQPLSYTPAAAFGGLGMATPVMDPALAVPLEEPGRLSVLVKGSDGERLPGAHVWAVGTGATSHAITGSDGQADLQLAADTPATLRALYIRPASGYWPLRIDHPHLTHGVETVVEVQALADTFEGPGQAMSGWGAQAMRLHQIPPTYRGHGVKIALLDSGADTNHPDLKDTVRTGYDFTRLSGEKTWQSDSTGHGTRCAGIIAAADNRTGITGIAAEAELHALKLFPGGHISDLLEAIDYCVTHGIDIAQINLAYPAPSQLAAWKLLDAHAAGIALIAPAGDTAGPVTQPAALPDVLAVGAIAHTARPAGSSHAAPQPPWPGPYPAPFTATGPGVDLAAPGTAVITTAPGDGYIPADGTTIAAAHITGLAALLLAHHDHLRTQTVPRTPARTSQLHTLLRAACRPIPGTDPARTGAGLADAPTALGIHTAWQYGPVAAQPHTATGYPRA